jgi:hypothetical protein
MDKIKELGKILLQEPPIEKSMRFGKTMPTCPAYDGKLIFMSEEREKEWEELDDQVKANVMKLLHRTTEQMETKIAIELLCHCINDLAKRVNELEGE